MIAALTLLPALLGFIGPRVLSRRQKRQPGGERPAGRRRGDQGVLAAVGRRSSDAGRSCRPSWPWSIIVLVALPFFSLRLGSSDQGNDPVGTTTRQAYDLLAAGFGPGFNGPLLLVAVRPTARPTPRPSTQLAGRGRDASPTSPDGDAAGVAARQGRQTGVADHRLPEVVTSGRGDHRPDRPPAHDDHPRGRGRDRGDRLRGREHRDLRRLRPRAVLRSCRSSSAWWSCCRSCCSPSSSAAS